MNDALPPTAGIRRFVLRVLVFLVPFGLGAAVLLTGPLDRTFAWHFVKGDCWGHGVWLDDRIGFDDAPVDVAFVGTSRTILGIDDRGIEAMLAERGLEVEVVNLGYCRNGRNLHTTVARDLLASKPVRHIVIEVANEGPGDAGNHRLFRERARREWLAGTTAC